MPSTPPRARIVPRKHTIPSTSLPEAQSLYDAWSSLILTHQFSSHELATALQPVYEFLNVNGVVAITHKLRTQGQITHPIWRHVAEEPDTFYRALKAARSTVTRAEIDALSEKTRSLQAVHRGASEGR